MAQPASQSNRRPVYALLLAAGAGSRFGGNKLLAPLAGRPLAAHAAATLAESIAKGVLAGGVAVVPLGSTTLAWTLDSAGLTLVENPDAAGGLSSSIRHGLAGVSAMAGSTAGAVVVALADQPRLRLEVITLLVEEWCKTGRSVRPRYRETPDAPGHPVLLDRSLWPLADRLQGDTGLRHLLAAQDVMVIEVGGSNPDVDRVEDLEALGGER